MSKIRVLPEQLANRIAAGEVVERPASVVKELIENSLDAGATRIEIEIEGGGTKLIRVMDDGEGMVEDDVLLCLERHGTSKITDDKDLEAISSLGFRGEAIPSISSVSRMTITSRHRDEALGTTAILNYGKLFKMHESGCSRGTIFEIRNLFGNTPARKKFLRTRRTEQGHIDEIVKNYGLAAPAVSFLLRVDGRQTLLLDSGQDLEQRLGHILHYQGEFIELGKKNRETVPRISGFLVPPDAQVKGSARIKLLVNGRSVKDRMLNHGVLEGLRGFLLKGKNPVGLLNLHIDPAEVDVNVHPTKQEVRFRQGRDIHQLIVQTIQEALQGYQHTLQQSFFSKEEPRIVTVERPQAPTPPVPPPSAKKLYHAETAEPAPPRGRPTPVKKTAPRPVAPVFHPQSLPQEKESRGHNLKVIGQFSNLYIFCQSEEGLLVIDQHAAHERLLFEKLKNQFLRGALASQNLMFPETVELSLADSEKVEQYSDTIEKMGFSIRDFGDNAFVISAVPALGSKTAPSELFLEVLEQFGSQQSKRVDHSPFDNILASMACKAAVKAGDKLSKQEIEALLTYMAKADLFSHCPHGRPVIKQFSDADIKKWFHRT